MTGAAPRKVWLGFGGNIGDVTSAMGVALRSLDDQANTKVVNVSSIYKTPPWGVTDQPWFQNCCAEIETQLSPEQLLDVCQDAERAGKRERILRWGPRTIDIDILVYDGVEQNEQRLTIPHPRIAERAFVLVPLCEIAADLVLNGNNVCQLAKAIDKEGIEKTDSCTDWWKNQ